MSKETTSYYLYLSTIESNLRKYPPIDDVFNSTDKFVLVLGENRNFNKKLQEYLLGFFYEKDKNFKPYRVLESYTINKERITFVLFDPVNVEEDNMLRIADAIYVKMILSMRRITAKVLCSEGICTYPSPNLCENCLAFINCYKRTPKPCIETSHFYTTAESFHQEIDTRVTFESVDLSTQNWVLDETGKFEVQKFFNAFYADVEKFAVKLGDYMAPGDTYTGHHNVTLQNETYTRFQLTRTFRFVRKAEDDPTKPVSQFFYIPDNIAEVFQQMNLSIEGIRPGLTDLTEKSRLFELLRPFRETKIQRNIFYEPRDHILDGAFNKMFSRSELTLMRQSLESHLFEVKMAEKFINISTHMRESISLGHADVINEAFKKLDTWVLANLLDLGSRNDTRYTITEFFGNLTEKVDKHFSYQNALMITSWFLRFVVPHDWQARLLGFGRRDTYWVTPEYDTIFDRDDMDFPEFVSILEYYLQKSVEYFEQMAGDVYQSWPEFFFNQDCGPKEIETFLQDWQDIFSAYAKEAKEVIIPLDDAENIIEAIKFLKAKYAKSFANVSIDANLLDCKSIMKRTHLYLKDNEDLRGKYSIRGLFDISPIYYEDFEDVLTFSRDQAKLLYGDFVDRTVQRFIEFESAKIDRTFANLSSKLNTEFLLRYEHDGPSRIQPFEKLNALTYTIQSFDETFSEVRLVFDTCLIDFPEEEFNYFKSLNRQFESLENVTKKILGVRPISTKWQWGRGLWTSSRNRLENSGRSLNFRSKKADFLYPCEGALNFNALLLLANLFVMCVRKFKWNF